MELIHGIHARNLRGDFYGGITAAVVALPLALAFGVASGAGPVAGLYGAIFVGFFAALFGGTPAQVSGPTGPMTVVMATVITQYAHEPAMAFTVVMMGGLIQIAFGVVKLGRYINLMPYPVVSGFMSGIGCIIILLQIAPFLGHSNPPGGTLAALEQIPSVVKDLGPHAAVLGLLSLSIAIFLPKRIGRIVPSPLLALITGTLIAYFVLSDASRLGEIPTGLPNPQLPTFELAAIPGMIKSALVLALLGSIDSLLTSLIADSVTRTHHHSDRELIGQGIANTVAGVFGAIPGAGATMRTVVNVRAGGLTPISGMLHALVLLLIVLGLGSLAAYIPHAVLAGILFKVGVDIIDWDYLRRVHKAPRAGVIIMLVVLGLTVFVGLITAVAVGVVMASLLLVKRMADLQTSGIRAIIQPHEALDLSDEEAEILGQSNGRVLLFHLTGPMSFASAKSIEKALTGYRDHDVLVLDLTDVPSIDSSIGLTLEEAIEQAGIHQKSVLIAGVRGKVEDVLKRLGTLELVAEDARFDSRLAALRKALAMSTEMRKR